MALSYFGSPYHGSGYHASNYFRPTTEVIAPAVFPSGGPSGPDLAEILIIQRRRREEEQLVELIAMMIATGVFDDDG